MAPRVRRIEPKLALLMKRLKLASDVERTAATERERLMLLAWQEGATDAQLADAMTVTAECARQRRYRTGVISRSTGNRRRAA